MRENHTALLIIYSVLSAANWSVRLIMSTARLHGSQIVSDLELSDEGLGSGHGEKWELLRTLNRISLISWSKDWRVCWR